MRKGGRRRKGERKFGRRGRPRWRESRMVGRKSDEVRGRVERREHRVV